MRLHFQDTPWDLYALVGYTVVVTIVLLTFGVRTLFAVFLLFLVPGYMLVAVLFPRQGQLDWTERIALSFILSVAVVPVLGISLNFTPFGIRLAPVVVTIALFTIVASAAAYSRRMTLTTVSRLSASIDLRGLNWGNFSKREKVVTVTLVSSIIVAAGSVAFLVVSPRPAEPFTELYILGPTGNATGYPTHLNRSQPGTVLLGIANHESSTTSYTVRIDLVGIQVALNITSGDNETREVNRTTQSWLNVSLVSGQNWYQSYTFSINATGIWKLQFLLFKDGDFSSAYRETHLFVRVS